MDIVFHAAYNLQSSYNNIVRLFAIKIRQDFELLLKYSRSHFIRNTNNRYNRVIETKFPGTDRPYITSYNIENKSDI